MQNNMIVGIEHASIAKVLYIPILKLFLKNLLSESNYILYIMKCCF